MEIPATMTARKLGIPLLVKPAISAVRDFFGGGPSTLRGMAIMAFGALSAALMNACARFVSDELHPFEIALIRSLIGLLVLAPVVARHRGRTLKTRRLGLHALRGGLQAGAMLLFFTAVSLTPLATIAALQFSAPLFATLLAFLVLHEIIRTRRISALVAGFAGTLIIMRPGFAEVHLGGLLVLASSAAWGAAMIVTKALSRTESSVTITVHATLVMTPLVLLAALPVWQTPTLRQLGWLVGVGALATLHNLCVAQAFKEADVTAVLPMDFTKLIWAAIIGYAAFAEVPDTWTWVGGIVIFSAATYIAYRERRVKAAAPEVDGREG